MDPDDLPPGLGWEAPVWDLYVQVSTQWMYAGMSGVRTGLNHAPALALMRDRGWDIGLGIALLGAIERQYLEHDASERK